MKKYTWYAIDNLIYILCFLFLLSSFFKVISYTYIEEYIFESPCKLLGVWVIGIVIACLFINPLYRWILHFRPQNQAKQKDLQ